MFDRKEAIIKDKKYYISNEYIKKLYESYNLKSSYNPKDENFKRIDTFEKPKNKNKINNLPFVIFNKKTQRPYSQIENVIKKDLIDNRGYLIDGGLQNKISKYKNQFFWSQSKKRFNSSKNDKNIQTPYKKSQSIDSEKKYLKSSLQKKEKKKIFTGEKIKSANVDKLKNKNLLIKRLTNRKIIKNLFTNFDKYKYSANINKDFQRKKEYLDKNNISYEDISTETNKKNFKNLNELKLNDKRLINVSKSNNIRNNIIKNKISKRTFKEDQFEYIHKIQKELNILRKSKDKNNKKEKEKIKI